MELKIIQNGEYYKFYKWYTKKEPELLGIFNLQTARWKEWKFDNKGKGISYKNNDYFLIFTYFSMTIFCKEAVIKSAKTIYDELDELHKHYFAKHLNCIDYIFTKEYCTDTIGYFGNATHIAMNDNDKLKAFARHINKYDMTKDSLWYCYRTFKNNNPNYFF